VPYSDLLWNDFWEDLNILAVDDEKAVTTTIKVVLIRSGHSVDALNSGQEAMEKIKESPNQYQILITDHLMPGVTGIQLLHLLKPVAFKGKIIVLSAHLTLELKDNYTALGVDRIIDKPFDVDELRTAVEQLKN